MRPGEHKTVQARILEYAEAIGWPLREESPAPNFADAPRLAPHLDVENGK